MAENQEDRSKEDLTEEISQFRLEEYRRKGMVPQSRELSGLAALLAVGATLYIMSPQIGANLLELMRDMFRTDVSAHIDMTDTHVLGGYFTKALKVMAAVGLPVCIAGFVLGIFVSFVQVGSIFSFDPITPDFSKVNPLSGIKRYFSLKMVMEGVRLVLKATVVVAVAYALVKSEVFQSPKYLVTDPLSLFQVYGSTGKAIFLSLIGVLSIFAFIEFGMNRWEFRQSLRMTKQESKQEFKEREGDPQIKARIRAVQREVARRRMMQAVKTADVIVTNPTHIAVALKYEKDKMMAPKVVAKGADFLAQKIKKIAAEAGIPLVENVPLARTLFKSVKIGQYVPRSLYQAVAEVLAYVYRLRNQGL